MITNVKRVMLLALVPVLQETVKQPSSLFSICTFQMKGNLNNGSLQKWHQHAQLQIFIQANITMASWPI